MRYIRHQKDRYGTNSMYYCDNNNHEYVQHGMSSSDVNAFKKCSNDICRNKVLSTQTGGNWPTLKDCSNLSSSGKIF